MSTSVSSQLPPESPYQDDEDDEPFGPSGFRSLERWEIAAYLVWTILSLAIITGWIWWQRAKAAGVL
jgi:hypothetical protein